MHLRGNVIYNTWENFWKKAYKSSYFRAQYDETSERTDWSLRRDSYLHSQMEEHFWARIPWADCTFVHSS